MVKALFCSLFLMFAGVLSADGVTVTAELQQPQGYANQPAKGMISIVHDKGLVVDPSSFVMGKDKLTVDFVQDVRFNPSSPTILSIYSFQLPGKPPGLYPLPSISVRVGDKEYHSITSQYTVVAKPGVAKPEKIQEPSAQLAVPAEGNQSGEPVLRLEAGIDGKTALYPGQRTRLVYTYSFRGRIALVTERLPLLDAEGLLKIGEKEIKDSTKGDLSVTEISQVVEAVKPGKYTFGPSLAEGYTYKNDTSGYPVYTSAKLTSEVAPIEIEVLPFPKQGMPASFNGAVGKMTFQTELLSPPKMEVDDEVTLALKITGSGNIKSTPTPDLCCQPGFSGFFRLDDLPPDEKIVEKTKIATIHLRLLTDLISAIPSVEFSYFDPDLARYVILHSKSIPIEVKQAAPKSLTPLIATRAKDEPSKPVKEMSKPAPLEIVNFYPLAAADLYNHLFGTWLVFALIPLGIAAILYQLYLREIAAQSRVTVLSSRELFQRAFAKKNVCDFDTLTQSLIMALVEAGEISLADADPERLPDEGLSKEMKAFLADIDEKRFGGGVLNIATVRTQAEVLLKKIRSSVKKEIVDAH